MNFGNSFTTIEQGERLIELGLPIDSCDCIYALWSGIDRIPTITYLFDKKYSEVMSDMTEEEINDVNAHPCWSVGRLMEIIDICDSLNSEEEYPTTKMVADKCKMGYIEYLVETIKRMKDFGELDFSKLED